MDCCDFGIREIYGFRSTMFHKALHGVFFEPLRNLEILNSIS